MKSSIETLKNALLCLLFIASTDVYAQYNIEVKIDGLSSNDELLLANHFGEKQYIKDTSEYKNGFFYFKGDEKLKNGVYLVVQPNKKFFEILISEDENQMKYSIQTDTTIRPAVTSVSGSKENELFLSFNQLAVEKSLSASKLKKEMDEETDIKKIAKIRKELVAIGKSVSLKRKEIADNNPTLFIGKLFNSMLEVESIETPEKYKTDREKQGFQYRWMREHYLDNVDFKEDGLVRSPMFHNKIKQYFDTYMPPDADTAIMMADNLINKIELGGSEEQYKYTIHYLVGHFEKTKYICFDKALWHMATNYYCAGKAFWTDSAYVAKMCDYSKNTGRILCGNKGADMLMPDTSFKKRIKMYDIQKPVTVLVFWDINCGTCKKELPVLSAMYDSMTNEHFEMYAVYTKDEWENWKKRIATEKYKFINVANAFGEDDYKTDYSIATVPQIFILDKDKNIRFKKLGAHQVAGAIQFLLEEQGIVEPTDEE